MGGSEGPISEIAFDLQIFLTQLDFCDAIEIREKKTVFHDNKRLKVHLWVLMFIIIVHRSNERDVSIESNCEVNGGKGNFVSLFFVKSFIFYRTIQKEGN